MSTAPMNRRDIAAEATRVAILDAARDAFGTRGYADVTLAEIAKSAKATTGALYHHFPDKLHLFTAVAEGVEADIAARLMAAAPQTSDVWELVEYAVLGTLDIAIEPQIARIIFDDAPNVVGHAAWREIEMRYGFGVLHQLVSALHATGKLASDDPAAVAWILLGALINAVESISTAPDLQARLQSCRDAMLRIVGAFRKETATTD